MALELIRMLSEASNAFNRVIQQAEEKIFDVEKTEYDDEYVDNVRKMNILIHLTETLIDETESMLEPNPAYRLEGKIMEKVDKKSDRNTPLENLGIAFDNASHDVKQYNYELYKDFSVCGKYQTKLGVASKEFQNKATDIYVSKLKKILDFELKKYKEEEEILENLRLDYDSLKIRIKKAITVAGKEALEKEFVNVDFEFHKKLEYNLSYFRSIDQYFDIHRELLKQFISSQSTYYMDCHSDLEKFKVKMESRILFSINGKSTEKDEDTGRLKSIKKFNVPKSMKIVSNEPQCIPKRNDSTEENTLPADSLVIKIDNKEMCYNLNISVTNTEEKSENNTGEEIIETKLENKEENSIDIQEEDLSAKESYGNLSEDKNQINLELSLTENIQTDEQNKIDLEEIKSKENEDLLPQIDLSDEITVGEEKEGNQKEESSLKVDVEDEEMSKENAAGESSTDIEDVTNKEKAESKNDSIESNEEDNIKNDDDSEKDKLNENDITNDETNNISNEENPIAASKDGDSADIEKENGN